MKTVDARGQLCPKPLILTKKALLEIRTGETMEVLIDNETSRSNVERFLKDNGMSVECSEENGVFRLSVTKTGDLLSKPVAEEYCETSPGPARGHIGAHAFVFKKARVADDELGEILTVGFFSTIGELDLLPGRIIFYHEGVRLVLDELARPRSPEETRIARGQDNDLRDMRRSLQGQGTGPGGYYLERL